VIHYESPFLFYQKSMQKKQILQFISQSVILTFLFLSTIGLLGVKNVQAVNVQGDFSSVGSPGNDLNSNLRYQIIESSIIEKLNQIRKSLGLNALKRSSKLRQVATLKFRDLIRGEYFAHTSTDGKNPWYWYKLAGYKYSFAGENLAMNFKNADEVLNAWMESPAHRENLLLPDYEEVAVVVGKNKHGKLLAVEEFGTPIETKEASIISELTDSDEKNKSPIKHSLQTRIVPDKFEIVSLARQGVDINNIMLLVVGIICLILIVNIWALEKEDQKMLLENGSC